MSKRLIGVLMIAVFAVFCMMPICAQAYHKEKSMADYSKKSCDNKIYAKAYFILKNSEELGLSDEQTAKIKTLKVEAKKELIRKNAEIKLLEIDIKSAMYADNIDVEAIGKLIDAKYDLKKEKAKNTINKYVELKGILTPEQKDTLKGLKKQCKMMK